MSLWSWLMGTPPQANPRTPISPDELKPIPDGMAPTISEHVEMYDSMEAQKRSLMHKQLALCNGEASGKQCKHYWTLVQIASSHTPDHLRNGERTRMCVYQIGAEPVIFDDGREGLAVSCNRYEPDGSPLHDKRGPFKDEKFSTDGDPAERKYDPLEEEFRPMSPEHIKMIQREEITSLRQLHALEEAEKAQGEVTPVQVPQPPVQTVSIADVLKENT